MRKEAAPLLPEIRQFLERLRPHPTKNYVLVNALGAGEYWGSNINGDLFPEASLIHEGQDYGYKTFYNAHAFKHHVNKDPDTSFGDIEVSVWHPLMKRVELIIAIDKERAQRFGAQDVVDKLDRGMFPDVSMGCLPAGTKILMADGSRKDVETVQVGDLVVSHRGVPKRVNEVYSWPNKDKQLCRIKLYGIREELPLTNNHPLWLVRKEQVSCRPSSGKTNKGRRQHVCTPESSTIKRGCEGCQTRPLYKFDWVRADSAEVGDYAAFPVPTFRRKLTTSTAEARLLGYYLAEGHILNWNEKKATGVQYTIGLHETDVLEDLRRCAEAVGLADRFSYWDNLEDHSRFVYINDSRLAETCATHCGQYSTTKRLSEEVLGADVSILKEFLGAYANGDGGAYNGSLYFSTASEELSEQLVIALARCRMLASVNRIVHKPSKKSVVQKETIEFQVWCGTDTSHLLKGVCRHDLRCSKKINSKRFFYEHEGTTYLLTPIEEIVEETSEEPVYNFSVESDDSYVAGGVATHNTKVPFDRCSVCCDIDKFEKAKATFDPSRHQSIGRAVLEWHRRDPIRGLSITRNDYCEHLRTQLNKILSDGQRICAINDYPRFFDISFVFIGADKTAKVMAKLASADAEVVPSWLVAEQLGYEQPETEKAFEKTAMSSSRAALAVGRETLEELMEQYSMGRINLPKGFRPTDIAAKISPPKPVESQKTAGVDAVRARLREKSASHHKGAEIIKDVTPSQFGGKAVPARLSESDLPRDLLDHLGSCPLDQALATPSGMGMLLKPREFQRIIIIRMGHRPLADKLDRDGEQFAPGRDREDGLSFGPSDFSSSIMRMLLPFLEGRSHLEPVAKRRAIKMTMHKSHLDDDPKPHYIEGDPILDKVSAAYNSYLDNALECIAGAVDLVPDHPELYAATFNIGAADVFEKVADLDKRVILGAIGGAYLLSAYAKSKVRQSEHGMEPPPGIVMQTLADHPHLAAALAGLAAGKLTRGSEAPSKLVDTGISVVKKAIEAITRPR
jgi:hypothetical protein